MDNLRGNKFNERCKEQLTLLRKERQEGSLILFQIHSDELPSSEFTLLVCIFKLTLSENKEVNNCTFSIVLDNLDTACELKKAECKRYKMHII